MTFKLANILRALLKDMTAMCRMREELNFTDDYLDMSGAFGMEVRVEKEH